VNENVSESSLQVAPFAMTAPPFDPESRESHDFMLYNNPQTEHFCNLIGIPNVINQSTETSQA
jgi:hypothetical protein